MKTYTLPVDEEGRIVLPPELRGRLGVFSRGQILLVADDQEMRLCPVERVDPFETWLGAAPRGDPEDFRAIRHAGMDEAELEILRAGPGARMTWLHLTPDPSSAPEAEHAPEGDNPFLTVLGAARLPEGMGTEEFMQKTRGAPDPARQDGPGARVMSLEDHLKRKP